MAVGNEKSALYDQSTLVQKTAGGCAIGFAALGVLLIAEYMKGSDASEGYWKGLNFKELIFNYHPIFMSTGLILFAITSILSYRLIPLPKTTTKPLHAFLHFCAISFVVMGLTCVIVGNNYPAYNDQNAYFNNLTSLHSFLGLGAVIVFAQNYILGFIHFLSPLSLVPVEYRQNYMPYHLFFGFLAVILATLAVETGLMELIAESKVCGYAVTSADTNPAANYHKLPSGCRVANGAGICILLATVLFIFAVYDFKSKSSKKTSSAMDERSLLKSEERGFA